MNKTTASFKAKMRKTFYWLANTDHPHQDGCTWTLLALLGLGTGALDTGVCLLRFSRLALPGGLFRPDWRLSFDRLITGVFARYGILSLDWLLLTSSYDRLTLLLPWLLPGRTTGAFCCGFGGNLYNCWPCCCGFGGNFWLLISIILNKPCQYFL